MTQRNTEPSASDSIDEFFEPLLNDAMDEAIEDEAPPVRGKSRLAELRRRAELRMEQKRMQEELGYMDLDWEEA